MEDPSRVGVAGPLEAHAAGFAAAITAAFPATVVQRCVVHYADLRVMPTPRRELQVAA